MRTVLRTSIVLVCSSFAVLCWQVPESTAKPLPAVTEADICNAGSVLQATYVSYSPPQNGEGISYFNPPRAEYRVLETVHGPTISASTITVPFDFDDGSACLEPTDWQFDPATMMPAAGSQWLLIVEAQADGSYRTFRGTVGRIPDGPAASEHIEQCRSHWN